MLTRQNAAVQEPIITALVGAVRALLPDLRDEGRCVICDAIDHGHTEDCPVDALETAYARVSPRRVKGRPAGQRIAEEPPAEAREVLGLDRLTNCDTCAHDYQVQKGARGCRVVDRLFGEDCPSDRLFDWIAEQTDEGGAPNPGATGCPDYARKEP